MCEKSKGNFYFTCSSCGSTDVNMTIHGVFSRSSISIKCQGCGKEEKY